MVEQREKIESGRPARVLVADDDGAILALAAYHFQGQPWEAEFVRDAREASAALAEREFDLLLLDMEMPGGGGAAVSVPGRRETVSGPVPKVLALSASCGDEGFVPPPGFDGGVAKPFTRDGLLDAVRAHLPGGASSASVRGAPSPAVSPSDVVRPPADAPGADPALAHLIPRVLRSLVRDADAVADALSGGDFAPVASTAHRVRGAAACYGLCAAADAAEDLERAARAGDADAAHAALDALRKTLSGAGGD